ncbi:MAG: T9SS type A sorting domain-containing protein [Bacteroidetes bacterium]|nr:T9SS type A sorting domain-containing protein [Bacteroidota bacterium]
MNKHIIIIPLLLLCFQITGQTLINEPNQMFPSVYDLRTYGWVSPVKDQGSCGACWAFATMSSIESSWLKNGYGTYDLSEDNLINCQEFDRLPCEGGNFYMSSSMFGKHSGPVSEILDPYGDTLSYKQCPDNPFPIQPVAFTADVRFLPKDINILKQAILDYGALATSMIFDMASYNSLNYTYYYNTTGGYPHCVTVTGWDDNIQFPGLSPGAWIIKDSYGTSWANNGYFYVSYYDSQIFTETAVFPARIPFPQFNSAYVYFYDDFGWIDNTGFSSNTAFALIHYSIGQFSPPFLPVQVKRIGTYAVEANSNLIIDIYRSFNGGILGDHLGTIESGTLDFAGFYSFPINLRTDTLGNDYYLRIKYTSPGTQKPIPIEIYETNYNSAITLQTGLCWISPDGASWTPIGNNTAYPFDLCIKLYCETAPLSVFHLPDSSQTGTPVLFHSESLPNGGIDSLKWYLNGASWQIVPSFNHIFEIPGLYEVSLVTYLGENSDTAINYLKIVNPVSLQDNPECHLIIKPNPFHDLVNISFLQTERTPVIIEILNIEGRILGWKDYGILEPGYYDIPITLSDILPEDISSGIYLLNFRNGRKIYLQKIIKQ